MFLVGTGRCGSQMLGRFLAAHPRILYINEFPDVDADSSRGRRDLVVRWGKQAAASR